MGLDLLNGRIAAVAIDATDALLIVDVLLQGVEDDIEPFFVFGVPMIIPVCTTLEAGSCRRL